MWRRSYWITFAMSIVGLVGVTVVAINWGTPLSVGLPNFSLGGRILFGSLVIVFAWAVLFPVYLAVHSRAVTTPPALRQLGLGTVEVLNTIQTPQASRPDAIPELSRMVGIITADATHWGPTATFEGFAWGFRIRPSRLPLPVKRVVPVLSSIWGGIETVEQVDYPSLIPVLVIKLRDPKSSLAICLSSVRSRDIVSYIDEHGIRIRFTDASLNIGRRET